MIDLKQLADLLEKDEEGRKRIADILASEIALRSRKILVEAVLKEIATKDDLEKMSKELKEYVDLKIDGLRSEMRGIEDKLSERIDSLEKRLEMLARFTFATFIGILLTLVSVILTRFL